MKLRAVKFHQAVNLPRGGVTNVNADETTSLETCPEGVLISLKDGKRFLVPFANVPYCVLADFDVQPTSKKK